MGELALFRSNQLAPYTPSAVDSPDAAGAVSYESFFIALVVGGFSLLLIFLFNSKSSVTYYLVLFLPIYLSGSTFIQNSGILNRETATVYDNAGLITRDFFSSPATLRKSKLLVVGSDFMGVYKTLFYLDSNSASALVLPDGALVDMNQMNTTYDWVVDVGSHEFKGLSSHVTQLPGFSLHHRVFEQKVDFTLANWPGILRAATGLSTPETWGTWSNGKQVNLVFEDSFPSTIKLILRAQAFGSNTSLPFTITIGSVTKKVFIPKLGEYKISFEDVAGSNTISIEIPAPSSPADSGGQDTRVLGIGLISINVQ